MRNLDIAVVHVGGVKRAVVHAVGGVYVAYQMGTCQCVALVFGEFFYAAYSFLFEIGLYGFVVGKKTGIVTIGRKQIVQSRLFDDISKMTVLRTAVDVIAHCLACERVVVLRCRIVGAALSQKNRHGTNHSDKRRL